MNRFRTEGETYDVVIVGSGAGGGTTTRVLTNAGIRVALLEAGPMLEPAKDFKQHEWPWNYGHRGAGEGGAQYFGQGAPFGYFTASAGGWQLDGEPYTVADGNQFMWFRSRVVGGRTNHYARNSYRISAIDMKARDIDGLGDNWPLSYDELAPYYDKVERFIGVTGTREGIASAPDGVFHEPPRVKAHEILIQQAGKELGIPFIPNRRAVITKSINGRPACHYCGHCSWGCTTNSNYSSSLVEIFPALETGNLTLVTDAMVREVTINGNGRATGVTYIDKNTRTERHIKARAVVLAASACESARILLNSKSSEFPNGLANGSGMVGRNLMDTVGFGLSGQVPAFEGMPRYDSDGFGGPHIYAPWWLWEDHAKLGFPRGYHIEFGCGFSMPGIGSVRSGDAAYGKSWKQTVREKYGSYVFFTGRGEMVPNKMSYCEIDPDRVDRWGIPVLRFHFRFSDYEWKQARHMEKTFKGLIESMGGTVLRVGNIDGGPQGISVGGSLIHEVGTVRMGASPRTSVLNSFCQAHEVKNLFVNDGASFVTNPDKNPTLTINAIACRASEYLAEEMRKGNV